MTDSYSYRDAEEGYSALLRTIEGDVIPRLVLAHRTEADGNRCDDLASPLRPGSTEVFELARLVLRDGNFEALAYLRDLQTRGMSTETIYIELLAPVARHLGVRWEDESSDFVEVTLGLQKLQDLAHQLNDTNCETSRSFSKISRRALVVTLPGEQHVFGSRLVGEFLRRAGWDVWDVPGAKNGDIVSVAREEWFAVIGFSISTVEQLPALTALIRKTRRAALNRDVRVMVGGLPFVGHAQRAVKVGADATANDGREAVAQAEFLLELLGRRN
ncbi:MAG: cobalamin B12-binding domain-containing protein [Gammaproteobacteria bacterium]|nr:cobalamin B12-binding domain-containing protein [Gammaproteobacteria bacterium]